MSTITTPRPRSRVKDLAMGALLIVVMAGGLTLLISRAHQTAQASTVESPTCDLVTSEME